MALITPHRSAIQKPSSNYDDPTKINGMYMCSWSFAKAALIPFITGVPGSMPISKVIIMYAGNPLQWRVYTRRAESEKQLSLLQVIWVLYNSIGCFLVTWCKSQGGGCSASLGGSQFVVDISWRLPFGNKKWKMNLQVHALGIDVGGSSIERKILYDWEVANEKLRQLQGYVICIQYYNV